ESGKPAPHVEIDDAGLTLRSDMAEALGSALIHALTNALDHGIEAPEERERLGKAGRGTIDVTCVRSGFWTRVLVRGDGRGPALEALRRDADTNAPDEVVAERIFASGVSTANAVTTSSGRGMGLDAARALLRQLGGDVRAVFTGPSVGGHRPF